MFDKHVYARVKLIYDHSFGKLLIYTYCYACDELLNNYAKL